MDKTLQVVLLESLINEGINELIQRVSNYLGYPIMLTDVGYRLITHYPEKKLGDPLWDAIHEYGATPPEFVSKLHAEKMMRLGGNNPEPYYLNWGFLEEHPRLLMNLCSKHKHYGYLAVLCDNNTSSMIDIVSMIGKVCVVALQKETTDILAATDYQTMFLKYLFDENGIKKEELKNWVQNLPNSISAPYYVGCCSFNNKQDTTHTHAFIQAAIKKAYPNILCYTYNREIIFLYSSIKDEEQVLTLVNMIKSAFVNYKPRFGVSNPFFELEKAYIYLRQARHSLKIANVRKITYLNYSDCMLEQFISTIYRGLPKESCIHNSINYISDYDKMNGTEYLKTLEIYVKSWFNSKKAVEMLHIHRNTLPHRLEMIEKIGKINLDDEEIRMVLLLNFYMELK